MPYLCMTLTLYAQFVYTCPICVCPICVCPICVCPKCVCSICEHAPFVFALYVCMPMLCMPNLCMPYLCMPYLCTLYLRMSHFLFNLSPVYLGQSDQQWVSFYPSCPPLLDIDPQKLWNLSLEASGISIDLIEKVLLRGHGQIGHGRFGLAKKGHARFGPMVKTPLFTTAALSIPA